MDASELLRPQHRVHQVHERSHAQQQRQHGHDVLPQTRSQRTTKANMAANVTTPRTIIPSSIATSYQAPVLLPNHHTRPTSAVFWSSRGSPGRGPVKNRSFDQSRRNSPRSRKPSANLYSSGRGELLQHLIDAAEQPLVVEALVAHRQRRRRGQLIARVGADALQRQRVVGLVDLVGHVVDVEAEAERGGRGVGDVGVEHAEEPVGPIGLAAVGLLLAEVVAGRPASRCRSA